MSAEPSSEGKDFRRMVEEIAVTPFFKRHRSHMPATLKLHAELREDKASVLLETVVEGFSDEDVIVEASDNTINISLRLEGGEGKEDFLFHNSYSTPVPVDPDGLKVVRKGGVLRVSVPKRTK